MANVTDDDYMVGPTSQLRIKLQVSFLSVLLCFGILTNGSMLILFARFKRLRTLTNYLLIDLTFVEFLDVIVNVPIFMEFFLLTKKKNLDRQTRWFAMFFHRFFLINDLFTQLAQSCDCFLAILFGRRFTGKKTHNNIIAVLVFKWTAILGLLLAFSIPNYKSDEETVSDEAYQRLLFGPSQIIWKTVIPSSQAAAVIVILMTNFVIIKSRNDVSVRYGMKVFGRGIKNNSKAVNTLFIIMVVQTLCKVPASVYSYIAVDDRIEGNRWFAFMAYYCLFLSSSIMPVIYFTRSGAFKRCLAQIRKHPFARNAYLDFAAHHGYTHHRNGRVFLKTKKTKKNSGTRVEQPESPHEWQEGRVRRVSMVKERSPTKTDDTIGTECTTKQSSLPDSATGLIDGADGSPQSYSFDAACDYSTDKAATSSDNNDSTIEDSKPSAQVSNESRNEELKGTETDSIADTDRDEGHYVITRMIVNVQIHGKDSEGPLNGVPSPKGNIIAHPDGDPATNVPDRDLNADTRSVPGNNEADYNSVPSNRRGSLSLASDVVLTMLDISSPPEGKPTGEEFDTRL